MRTEVVCAVGDCRAEDDKVARRWNSMTIFESSRIFLNLIVCDLSSARVIACARGVRGLDQNLPSLFSHTAGARC